LPPGDLDKALCGVAFPSDENVIIGLERADDAGVYRLSDELALIQTVDFFTPIVDDPYWFGQIAAANALSDVYAMGGTPKTAMNLVAFPAKTMDLSILRQIIQGGVDKLKEAEVVLIGGHSIEDKEIKYGLSVTGVIHPKQVLAKKNLRPERQPGFNQTARHRHCQHRDQGRYGLRAVIRKSDPLDGCAQPRCRKDYGGF
jgi:selenide,water dikinase